MLIPLNEPSNFRYIHINPAINNYVHLLVPFIAGMDVSTDNTCKSYVELRAFFEGGAFNELESYKSTLDFHLLLLEESNPLFGVKKKRLDQINLYLEAVASMRDGYQPIVTKFLSKPSNLYSIQLRPRFQDSMSLVVNPVFTINRENDSGGTPLSPLYNKMHEVFSGLVLGKPDPRTELIYHVLDRLPSNATFDDIKHTLKSQCTEQFKVDIDVESWIRPVPSQKGIKELVDKAHIDAFMRCENASPKDYIDALLGCCTPNLWKMLPGSPFYLGIYDNTEHQTESLSLMTQFYLGVLNVYCRAKGISDRNFGVILDGSSSLSQELVEIVAEALRRGDEIEPAIIAFFNLHKNEFKLVRDLNTQDNNAIIQKFEATYRTVTATKENPHMDDFMFLDTEAQGEHDIFITNKGLICTDAANILPTTPQNKKYFAAIRREARMHRDIVTPQDEPIITIDIAPESLIDKLVDDVQWEILPVDVAEACRALPVFKVRKLLDNVAKGKQDEADAILESFEDKQTLLRTPSQFTDYSGRTFHCTAYEYAYWAKDTHMQRMLERHMDDETRAFMLENIDVMEQVGLSYQQRGIRYQNAHYDMSFILKHLNADDFCKLQTMVGQSNSKIQQATINNYQNISFTATEYEALKKRLEQYRPRGTPLFFRWSQELEIIKKLRFDFHSLITALDSYVTNFDPYNFQSQTEALMTVGQAQRDVPAHVAHEYCRPDRSFAPLPSFTEETLPRVFTFHNYLTNITSWFPLSSSSGLGFQFALIRAEGSRAVVIGEWWRRGCDSLQLTLAAVRHLDEVRIADLTQSRENLSRPTTQLGLGH